MATDRPRLDLELNTPVTLELLFDNPLQGENRYGPYFLYALRDADTGEEYSYFAPDDVHHQLKDLRRGDVFTLTKLAAQKGRKITTEYKVVVVSHPADDLAFPVPASNGNGVVVAPVAKSVGDILFEAMLASYEDAIRIHERRNGLVDVNRIAITLFIARSKGGAGVAYAN